MKRQETLNDFTRDRFAVNYFIFKNELLNFCNAETARGDLEHTHFFKIIDIIEELNNALLFLIEDRWLDKELAKLKV